MKMADGGFRPAYNVQFATDTKSTSRPAQGRARAARNALRHGLNVPTAGIAILACAGPLLAFSAHKRFPHKLFAVPVMLGMFAGFAEARPSSVSNDHVH
jgi:hypothetical protein